MGKKKRKHERGYDGGNNDWAVPPQYGAWPGAMGAGNGMPGAGYGMGAGGMGGMLGADYGANAMDAGILQGLPAMLRSRHTEQFLLGALVGAAAAWVLSDEEMRAKLIKTGVKLYSGLAGGFEEMKEQMADIKAEVQAERHGET